MLGYKRSDLPPQFPKCVVKDLCSKADQGFSGSEIMRTTKQKNKYEKRQQKGKQPYSQPANQLALPSSVGLGSPGQNMGPMQGTAGYMDVEAALRGPDAYSEMGRAKYMDPRSIPVHEFDPTMMPTDSSSVLFGIRRTGKSWFMRWFLYVWSGYFTQVYMFTKTKANGFWVEFIPEKFVYEGIDEARIEQIIELQHKIKADPDWAEANGLTERTIVLFDDVLSESDLRSKSSTGAVSQLYVEGRHHKLCCMLATQNPTAIAPQTRDNLDFAVFFKVTKNSSKDRFQDEYMGRLNKKTAFELIDMYTNVQNKGTDQETRQCLVVCLDPGLTYNER